MPKVTTVRPNGAEVRRLREELGLRPRELAAKIGRHEKSINRIEWKPDFRPSRLLMGQVARALGVSINDITLPPKDTGPSDDEKAHRAAA